MAVKKADKSGGTNTLLVELLTEELPPKALQRLSQAFCDALVEDLRQDLLLAEDSQATAFATPRRLAVSISNVLAKAPDSPREILGPSVKVGLDTDGKPTPALFGFAKKNGVTVDELVQIDTPKGKVFGCRTVASGTHLETNLALKIEEALKRLPVPKTMRWGNGNVQFARPVHGLIMLHGSKAIPGEVLGIESSKEKETLGHRFLSDGAVVLKDADDYEGALGDKGKVIPDFAKRRSEIKRQLERAAGGATLIVNDSLLDEISALVEAPAVYQGQFEPGFLAVPEECLILSMQQHQRYVPLRDKATGKLLPRFLFVSNILAKDPGDIIHGNERVLNARLSDAKFFYDQDRKTRLEARVPRLSKVVYHNKLGSQLDRVERIKSLAGRIASQIGADQQNAERAAYLSKADLLTEMVGEFPELQGIMGGYYAEHDGEPKPVVQALVDQYKTRDETVDPENLVSLCLYLGDRLESLVGLFGIGEAPTGERDPFGLRRAALGVIKAYELLAVTTTLSKRSLPDVREFLDFATPLFPAGRLIPHVASAVYEFILERYWYQLATIYAKNSVEAVISQKPHLTEINRRVQAVESFCKLPEAESLATANKRIRNILRRSEAVDGNLDETLLTESAERLLHVSLNQVKPLIANSMQQRDYNAALKALASLRAPVDTFFDKVLVNAEDPRLRANRHALLRELNALLNQVADISKLAA